MQVAVSWSGGKESCLACHRAVSDGFKVSHLLNLASKDGRSMSHGIDRKLMCTQSQAVGIPLVQKEVTWETYEQGFKNAVGELKKVGVEGVVFGDIGEVPGHGDWTHRVCGELAVRPITPLWGLDPKKILTKFIGEGFEAVVVSAKADLLGKEWLGRRIDRGFVRDILEKIGVDPCGEFGEYHTLVIDGPMFRRRLEIIRVNEVLKDGYWFLDISGFEAVDKRWP